MSLSVIDLQNQDLVTAFTIWTLLYHTCRKIVHYQWFGCSLKTVLIVLIFYLFQWEFRFPFEMKEFVVKFGKWNRKSTNLGTNKNKTCNKEVVSSGVVVFQCHHLPTYHVIYWSTDRRRVSTMLGLFPEQNIGIFNPQSVCSYVK